MVVSQVGTIQINKENNFMQMNDLEKEYIQTREHFYRSTSMKTYREGRDTLNQGCNLSEELFASENESVREGFYGESCDYVWEEWN